jgi:hypothetical protein
MSRPNPIDLPKYGPAHVVGLCFGWLMLYAVVAMLMAL